MLKCFGKLRNYNKAILTDEDIVITDKMVKEMAEMINIMSGLSLRTKYLLVDMAEKDFLSTMRMLVLVDLYEIYEYKLFTFIVYCCKCNFDLIMKTLDFFGSGKISKLRIQERLRSGSKARPFV